MYNIHRQRHTWFENEDAAKKINVIIYQKIRLLREFDYYHTQTYDIDCTKKDETLWKLKNKSTQSNIPATSINPSEKFSKWNVSLDYPFEINLGEICNPVFKRHRINSNTGQKINFWETLAKDKTKQKKLP